MRKIIILLVLLIVHCASNPGRNFLESANQGDSQKVLNFLDAGVDIRTKEPKFGNSALHLASYEGHKKVVQILLSRGADPNCKADDGITPLIAASRKGHIEIAEMLLVAGAKVNDTDEYGVSPIMSAAFVNNKPLVQLLLEKGADPTLKNLSGKTASDKTSDEEIKKILLQGKKK